jgi:F0F1-type ATP synthase assembly protein I
MKSVNSLVQSLLLAVAVLVFYSYGFGLDALYGALISFINTWLFDYFMHTQKAAVNADAQKSFRMAIKSSVLRIFSLAMLTLIGLSLLALDPGALILSLVVGQVGFILDRFRQK